MGSRKKSKLLRKLKPWKERFFQFIMLFLAVTLGFFAENYRDDFTEKVKMKQYARALYDDLKNDTAIIQRTTDEKAWIWSKLDSAEVIISLNQLTDNNEFIYYIERFITLNDVFTSQNVTYQQLQSSGNFRYMKNVALYKQIAAYYNLYSRYQLIDVMNGLADKPEISLMESKLFNINDLMSLNNDAAHNFYTLVNYPERKFEPIINDKENLALLHLQIANAKIRVNHAYSFLSWLKRDATALIIALKEEYKL